MIEERIDQLDARVDALTNLSRVTTSAAVATRRTVLYLNIAIVCLCCAYILHVYNQPQT